VRMGVLVSEFNPAKKYMSAGALCRVGGRVLLVNPTYKPRWEIPGGLVEDGESPRAACLRELREELGLELPVARLLGVDYRVGSQYGEGLHFIFDCGELSAAALAAITLPPDELSEHRLAHRDELHELLAANLARRVLRCLDVAIAGGAPIYMEDGEPLA